MPRKRKLNRPRQKPGVINVWYGTLSREADRYEPDDVCMNWEAPAHKGVGLYLMELIAKSKFALYDNRSISVIDYLKEHGYDLSTLRLTVERKTDEVEPQEQT